MCLQLQFPRASVLDFIYNLYVTRNFKTVLNNTNQLFKTGFRELDVLKVSILVE
jgi:hypothetical protein